jgi:hypothetical protein
MSIYKKSDLKGSYQWTTTDDDPKLKGVPDSALFNRHQGWEVLYMANKIAEDRNLFAKQSLHKFEDLLEKLPSDTRGQKNVFEWINKNW